MAEFTKALQWIDDARTDDELRAAIPKFRDLFDLAHVTYHAVSLKGKTERGPHVIVTYPALWVRRYLDENYQRIDPVVVASLSGFIPVDWRLLDFSGKREATFLDEASEFEISSNGVSYPIRGPGGEQAIFSVNAPEGAEWDSYISEHQRDFMFLGHCFHQKVRQLASPDRPDEVEPLSMREQDVLYWLARGKTYEDVGDILYISPRTVKAHIESARYKLNAGNTVHAVAKAVTLGFITPV